MEGALHVCKSIVYYYMYNIYHAFSASAHTLLTYTYPFFDLKHCKTHFIHTYKQPNKDSK